MKKIFFPSILIFVFSFAFSTFSFAEGLMGNNMMGGNNAIMQNDDGLPAEASAQVGHTAREEAEGKAIWEKLQAEELKCEDLSDENFGSLGEYFMGQMAGEQHEAMNNMMIRMMGEEGEKQMHVAVGKRMSGCEPNAQPSNMMDSGMTSMMMNMMMGGGNSMMGGWGQNPTWLGGVSAWLISLLWLVWLVVGILAAIWLWKQIIKK